MRIRPKAVLCVLALTIIASLLADVRTAHACECSDGGPIANLDRVESAFVGVATEVVGTSEDKSRSIVRFEVTEPIKGEAAAEALVMVNSHEPGTGDCGDPLFVPGGAFYEKEAGVQLRRGRAAEACISVSPDFLRSGQPGLDQPAGDQPAIAVAVGEFRGTHIRLLGEHSRVVAYVVDEQLSRSHALCTDGTTLVSVVRIDGESALRYRDLVTLEPIRDLQLDLLSATEEIDIRSCVDDHRTLIDSGTELRVIDTDGEVARFDYGLDESGMINRSGTHFSRWREFRIIETTPIADVPTEPIVVEVANHLQYRIAPSPDGTRLPFLRRDRDIGLRLIVVDTDGNELHSPLNGKFAYPIGWLDDSSLTSGTTSIDFSSGQASITAPVGNPRQRPISTDPNPRAVISDAGDLVVLDRRTGEQTPLGTHWEETLIALPESTLITGTGFVPEDRPALPINGEAVPDSLVALEALVNFNADGERRFGFDFEALEDAADADAVVDDSAQDSQIWLYGGTLLVMLAAGVYFTRRRGRQ